MKTFIGKGNGNPKEAVSKATSGLTTPTAIIFIAPYNMLSEVATILSEEYKDVPTIGTVGTKLVNGIIDDNNVAVLAFFDDVKVRAGVMKDISKCPVIHAKEIQKKMSEISANKEDTVCIEYCTGSEEKLVTTYTSCFAKKGISLVGGTVFGVPDGKQPLVAYNGNVYEDASVYMLVRNLTGKVRVYKENIYENNSKYAHFATKVDIDKKALIELDGRMAADVYSEELNIPKSKIIDNVFINPMGRVVGDEVYISSMMTMESNGTLVNYKRINKNDCIYFLSLGDYKNIEHDTRNHIKNDAKKISLVLSIDCVYRYLFYSNEGYATTYAKDMASLGQHFGVVGGGEQYNNQHVNQTMVCVVFE